MSEGHGGNLRQLALQAGCDAEQILDFSANINPLGPPESFRAIVSRSLESTQHYPDPNSAELVAPKKQYRQALDTAKRATVVIA